MTLLLTRRREEFQINQSQRDQSKQGAAEKSPLQTSFATLGEFHRYLEEARTKPVELPYKQVGNNPLLSELLRRKSILWPVVITPGSNTVGPTQFTRANAEYALPQNAALQTFIKTELNKGKQVYAELLQTSLLDLDSLLKSFQESREVPLSVFKELLQSQIRKRYVVSVDSFVFPANTTGFNYGSLPPGLHISGFRSDGSVTGATSSKNIFTNRNFVEYSLLTKRISDRGVQINTPEYQSHWASRFKEAQFLDCDANAFLVFLLVHSRMFPNAKSGSLQPAYEASWLRSFAKEAGVSVNYEVLLDMCRRVSSMQMVDTLINLKIISPKDLDLYYRCLSEVQAELAIEVLKDRCKSQKKGAIKPVIFYSGPEQATGQYDVNTEADLPYYTYYPHLYRAMAEFLLRVELHLFPEQTYDFFNSVNDFFKQSVPKLIQKSAKLHTANRLEKIKASGASFNNWNLFLINGKFVRDLPERRAELSGLMALFAGGFRPTDRRYSSDHTRAFEPLRLTFNYLSKVFSTEITANKANTDGDFDAGATKKESKPGQKTSFYVEYENGETVLANRTWELLFLGITYPKYIAKTDVNFQVPIDNRAEKDGKRIFVDFKQANGKFLELHACAWDKKKRGNEVKTERQLREQYIQARKNALEMNSQRAGIDFVFDLQDMFALLSGKEPYKNNQYSGCLAKEVLTPETFKRKFETAAKHFRDGTTNSYSITEMRNYLKSIDMIPR